MHVRKDSIVTEDRQLRFSKNRKDCKNAKLSFCAP